MAIEIWMRAPIYGTLVLLLTHCGLEQARQSQSVPKNQGKTQVKMGDTLAVSQPAEPPKASENLVAAKPAEPPKASENLVAAKPEEPAKASENPDAKADCLRNFRADRFTGIIGSVIGDRSVIGGGAVIAVSRPLKMCTPDQNFRAPYEKCGIPLPSSYQHYAFPAVMEPCDDQESRSIGDPIDGIGFYHIL